MYKPDRQKVGSREQVGGSQEKESQTAAVEERADEASAL